MSEDVIEVPEGEESAPESNAAPEPTWWWDKSTPGSGERPDWLPAKYKSAEDTAKAFKELEKRLGSAPEKYDWSKGESWIDAEYEPFQKMAEYAKSKHVPQDVMDNMLETVGVYLNEFNTDVEEEKAALGEKAEERLERLDNWVKSNFTEGTYNHLVSSMRTARDVEAFEELRNKMIENTTTIPTGKEAPDAGLTVKDVQNEMSKNYDRYKTDESYRNEIKAKFEKAVGNG